MVLPVLRSLYTFFFPGAVIFITALLVVRFGMQNIWTPVLMRIFPFAILGAGIFFGWRFNRSRLVYGTLAIFLSDRIIRYY